MSKNEYQKKMKEYEVRNLQIVTYLLTGVYTLKQMGDKYNVSKERIRQIFLRETGLPFYPRRVLAQKKRIKAWRKQMNEIAYYCKYCKKPVKYAEKSSGTLYCLKCRIKRRRGMLRDNSTTFICTMCKKKYHPYHNWRYLRKPKKRYCSMECYCKRAS